MEKNIIAHMPGIVARVVVSEGDRVQYGQEVAVINCMKTELSIMSDCLGVVKKILVKEWDEMEIGNPMIILESLEG